VSRRRGELNELVLHRRPGWGRWNAAAARGAVPRHRPGHRSAHLPRESRVNRGSSLGARAFADGEQREKQDIVEEPTSWQKVIGVAGGGGGRVGFWPNVGKGAFGCHLRGSAVAGLPFYDVVVWYPSSGLARNWFMLVTPWRFRSRCAPCSPRLLQRRSRA
jgi:hypothetical protein